MAIEMYFGERFAQRLRDLLWKYDEKVYCEFSDPKRDGSFSLYLITDELAVAELADIQRECIQMCELSVNPCQLKWHQYDDFEFIVKSNRARMLNDWLRKI